MSDEQKGRSNSLLAELLSVVLDVDDDDRDIIRVVIGITNESAVPISNIDSSIDTIGKGSYTAERSVSSIGPGLTRNFHFILGADLGHWVFNLSHGNGPNKDSLEIGPVRADLRIGEMLEEEVELAGSSIGGGIGGGLIADVFSEALGDFGNLRETIEIKMEFEATPESSSRELENEDEIVQNNTTKIELKPASPISKSWEEVPSSPPPKPSMSPPPKPSMSPQKTVESQDPLLSPDILNKISQTSGYAFGAEQLLHLDGETDTGRDIYLTYSKAIWSSNKEDFPLSIFTVGAATGKMAEGSVKFFCSDLFGGSGTEIAHQRSLCWAPVFTISRVHNNKISTFFEYNSFFEPNFLICA